MNGASGRRRNFDSFSVRALSHSSCDLSHFSLDTAKHPVLTAQPTVGRADRESVPVGGGIHERARSLGEPGEASTNWTRYLRSTFPMARRFAAKGAYVYY
jgi:hypothetical protein